jgi:hypothetical protein
LEKERREGVGMDFQSLPPEQEDKEGKGMGTQVNQD